MNTLRHSVNDLFCSSSTYYYNYHNNYILFVHRYRYTLLYYYNSVMQDGLVFIGII